MCVFASIILRRLWLRILPSVQLSYFFSFNDEKGARENGAPEKRK